MKHFISTAILLIFYLSTINCSKINFKAVDQTDTDGSGPEIPFPPIFTGPVSKLDILFVIDNSLSMVSEHQAIAKKLAGFTKKLAGINYQIAVTTTDSRVSMSEDLALPVQQTPRGFGGKAVSFNGQNFISPSTPNGENLILASLDRSLEASCDANADKEYWGEEPSPVELCSSSSERPIKVIKQFIKQKETANAGFLRDGVALAVVIITDEDATFFNRKNKSIAKKLKAIRLLKPKFKAYGIITEKHDLEKCQSNWSGHTSVKVQKFIKLSGGFHNSICDTNYTSLFDKITKSLN